MAERKQSEISEVFWIVVQVAVAGAWFILMIAKVF
jgi:hypothetical protein